GASARSSVSARGSFTDWFAESQGDCATWRTGPDRGPSPGAAVAQELDDPGHEGERDDGEDDQREVAPHHRDVAEDIATDREDRDPADAARDVVEGEARVGHPAHARDERGEGANDRHEAGDHDGLRAVALVEFVGALEVLAIEEAHVLPVEHAWAE